jgi:hypothetical protein
LNNFLLAVRLSNRLLDDGPFCKVSRLRPALLCHCVPVLLEPLLGGIFLCVRDEVKTLTPQQLMKQPTGVLGAGALSQSL